MNNCDPAIPSAGACPRVTEINVHRKTRPQMLGAQNGAVRPGRPTQPSVCRQQRRQNFKSQSAKCWQTWETIYRPLTGEYWNRHFPNHLSLSDTVRVSEARSQATARPGESRHSPFRPRPEAETGTFAGMPSMETRERPVPSGVGQMNKVRLCVLPCTGALQTRHVTASGTGSGTCDRGEHSHLMNRGKSQK